MTAMPPAMPPAAPAAAAVTAGAPRAQRSGMSGDGAAQADFSAVLFAALGEAGAVSAAAPAPGSTSAPDGEQGSVVDAGDASLSQPLLSLTAAVVPGSGLTGVTTDHEAQTRGSAPPATGPRPVRESQTPVDLSAGAVGLQGTATTVTASSEAALVDAGAERLATAPVDQVLARTPAIPGAGHEPGGEADLPRPPVATVDLPVASRAAVTDTTDAALLPAPLSTPLPTQAGSWTDAAVIGARPAAAARPPTDSGVAGVDPAASRPGLIQSALVHDRMVGTPSGAPTSAQTAAPPLAAQLSGTVLALAARPSGEHMITLSVQPEGLGPVTVRAVIGADGIRIELLAPDHAREALRAILPDLRRDLSTLAQGARLDLGSDQPGASSQSSSQQQPAGGGAARGGGDGALLGDAVGGSATASDAVPAAPPRPRHPDSATFDILT